MSLPLTAWASVSVSEVPSAESESAFTVNPEIGLALRITVTVKPPGAAGIEAGSSASSKVTVSAVALTAARATSGARVSDPAVTASTSMVAKPTASFPAASRIFVPEGGVYSRVTFCVPTAISESRLSVVFEPTTDTAITVGSALPAIFTANPPVPVGTELSSSASDQITVTVGPSAVAALALGRNPSTMRAASASTASCARCTARLFATATMELPEGVCRASAAIAMPSLSSSPTATVYSKRSRSEPDPEA